MSGLLSAFWHAVAGDGSSDEPANEVRAVPSKRLSTTQTYHRASRSPVLSPTDRMFYQLDHAPPPPNVLPPYPFASAQPSSHHASAHVDLTADESQDRDRSPIPIYEDDILPKAARSRLHQSAGNAERRSTAAQPHRKHSEATRAPNPANGYQGPHMTKPGADKAFRPTNTFNSSVGSFGINPRYSTKHPKTYGRQDRNTSLIGRQRHVGQEKYLELHPAHASSSYSNSGLQPSQAKRRKVEHSASGPTPTIEIGDSEGEEAPQRPPVPRQASIPRAHSISSSRSPHSTTSKQSGAESKQRTLAKSEFNATSDLLAAKRTRRRHKNSNEAERAPRSRFNGSPVLAGSLSHGRHREDMSSVEPLDHADTEQAERGPNDQAESLAPSNRANEKVTSKFFTEVKERAPNNESTGSHSEYGTPIGSRSSKNLRDFQSARSNPSELHSDPIDNSEDELSRSIRPKPKPKPVQAPSKPARQGKATSRSKNALGQEYRLSYARTYTTQTGIKGLLLSQNDPKDRTHFRISGTDASGKEKTLHQLNLEGVTQAWTDDTHRIRLLGPASQGTRYWFDLAFEDAHQFLHFRNRVISPSLAKSRQWTKTPEFMERIFENPLTAKGKTDQSSPLKETKQLALPAAREKLQTSLPSFKARMADARNIASSAASSVDDLRDPTTRTRPLRNTRSTVPAYQAHQDEEKKVAKSSESGKLGKSWPNHLDYSIQESFLKRRRCTVNFDDLPKLDEEEFLNDSLVNFYLLYLYRELQVSVDRIYFFNTYFFDTLTKNVKKGEAINYDAVKSWTKRDDIFSYDHIVVPINEKFHWYLAIICNISNIPRKHAAGQSEEDAQHLDQSASDLPLATTISSNEIVEERQPESKSVTPAPEPPTSKDIEEDEENLFEEDKKLSLIDRNEEDAGNEQASADAQTLFDGPAEQEPAATATLQSKDADDHITSSAPNKPKQLPKKKRPAGPKKDPEKPVIVVLDSLGSMHSNATRALREWLEAEGLEKRNMTVEIDNKGYYPKSAHIPMQNNFSDCGLYVLGYAKKFFADPDAFKNKLLKAEMSSATDWPDMDAFKMRDDIRRLIFRLYEEQESAKKEARKARKAAATKSAISSPTKAEFKDTGAVEQQPASISAGASSIAPSAVAEELQSEGDHTERNLSSRTTPRLGSPFSIGVRTDQDHSNETHNVNEPAAPATPIILASPQKTNGTSKSTLPKGSPAKRHKSPEVRVPHKSPHLDTSLYERFDGATDRLRHSPRRRTDLSSPLRKHGLHSVSEEEVRTPSVSKTKKTRSPRNDPRPLSPTQSRTRSGSHDDPISLEDSQDLDAPLQRPPQSSKVSLREVIELDRSQEEDITPIRHISPAKRNARHIRFDDEDSIQEVFSQDWQEGRDLSRAMRASLEDQQAKPTTRPSYADDEHIDLWEGSFDEPAIPSESAHTLEQVSEAQAMDIVDDAEIPESPQQRRSSPGVDAEEMEWQSTEA